MLDEMVVENLHDDLTRWMAREIVKVNSHVRSTNLSFKTLDEFLSRSGLLRHDCTCDKSKTYTKYRETMNVLEPITYGTYVSQSNHISCTPSHFASIVTCKHLIKLLI